MLVLGMAVLAASLWEGHSAISRGASAGIWISPEEVRALPTNTPAWNHIRKVADQPLGVPRLSDQTQADNVVVLAKALVYVRTGEEKYRSQVIAQCMRAIGSERGGTTLALGRELAAYVIAADLVKLPPDQDREFRLWLRRVIDLPLEGRTLKSTHEERPNNWGTHAGASRAAVARYLDDNEELDRVARVFKGWLGDRDSYAGFIFGDLDWQCDPESPVGINPKGCTRNGVSLDGVLPDDQRRAGGFKWPPQQENYVYEALQGALVQAHILERAGYDAFSWEDKALLRAYRWLHDVAKFKPEGDDVWQAPLVDFHYGTSFWNRKTADKPGKNMAWTDWTHDSINPDLR